MIEQTLISFVRSTKSIEKLRGRSVPHNPMPDERNLEEKSVLISCFSSEVLTPSRSNWRFSDGVSVDEDLRNVNLEKIRAVCNQQSWSRWTEIASRNRLYQFMALSDEDTQKEMRQAMLNAPGGMDNEADQASPRAFKR